MGAILIAKDVLWLEISVEDSLFVAIFDRIDDLQENISDESVVVEIAICCFERCAGERKQRLAVRSLLLERWQIMM